MIRRYALHCAGTIYILDLLFVNYVIPQFRALDYKQLGASDLVYQLFPAIFPGALSLLMLFYGLLHCWQNM